MIPERFEILMKVVLASILISLFLLLVKFVWKQLLHKEGGPPKNSGRQVVANAVVLSVEYSGAAVNRQAKAILQMQVLPDKGRNFVAEIKAMLYANELAAIKTGCAVKVRYNPANIKEIALVN